LGWLFFKKKKNDSIKQQQDNAAIKAQEKDYSLPPVRTPIIVNKSSRGRFQRRVNGDAWR
jgi:hypothetical protein